ncbi:MAG TPA: hypothetical protein VFZ68_09095 [Acidimicrobiales bacterium]
MIVFGGGRGPRVVGGVRGCLTMLLISLVASVVLTVLVNVLSACCPDGATGAGGACGGGATGVAFRPWAELGRGALCRWVVPAG